MTIKAISFIAILLVGMLTAPLPIDAQEPGKIYRIGWLGRSTEDKTYFDSFLKQMHALGWVEGKHFVMVYELTPAGQLRKQAPALAAKLIERDVDIIVTSSTPAAISAKNATATIPIVMSGAARPVKRGLIERKTDAYQVITDRILSLLEQGTVPWHKPWNSETGMPKNLASGKPYRGINVFMLGTQHYGSPWWLTFKQCKARGGSVKRGEKSTPVVFWKVSEYTSQNVDTGEEETRKGFLLRSYNAFNVEQCTGVEYPSMAPVHNDIQPVDECERIVEGIPGAPMIRHMVKPVHTTDHWMM